MWVEYNPNPLSRRVGDCSVRAIAKAIGISWEEAYTRLSLAGFLAADMPSSDAVWGNLLSQNGFEREVISNSCPDCYTAEDFCRDNPNGTYVLAFGGHVATAEDGKLYDSWDSSSLAPAYYWKKPEPNTTPNDEKEET